MSITKPTKRLFIGSFLDFSEQERLFSWHLHNNLPVHQKLRFVKREKLHITWSFLGSIDEAAEQNVLARLASIVPYHPSFCLTYTQAIIFPSEQKPHSLALVPSKTNQAAKKLANAIKNSLHEFCQKPDKRDFHPHLTILRFPPSRYKADLPNFPPFDFLPVVQAIKSVCLIESHLGTQKNAYEIIKEFPLA